MRVILIFLLWTFCHTIQAEAAKKVTGAEIEDAKKWHESSARLWTVVVAPWVSSSEMRRKTLNWSPVEKKREIKLK